MYWNKENTKAMKYFVLALAAYNAVAETIFDRLINATIVCQVLKPMLMLEKYRDLNWSHQAILTLLKSTTNIFLIQSLGEYHELNQICLKKKKA